LACHEKPEAVGRARRIDLGDSQPLLARASAHALALAREDQNGVHFAVHSHGVRLFLIPTRKSSVISTYCPAHLLCIRFCYTRVALSALSGVPCVLEAAAHASRPGRTRHARRK
jgi:hypothetical protein